jgi:hypothetical protein
MDASLPRALILNRTLEKIRLALVTPAEHFAPTLAQDVVKVTYF